MQALASEGRTRYQPAPLLVEMARTGGRFFPDA
jgi:hypothetical protein